MLDDRICAERITTNPYMKPGQKLKHSKHARVLGSEKNTRFGKHIQYRIRRREQKGISYNEDCEHPQP
jgi:hypothetical protein